MLHKYILGRDIVRLMLLYRDIEALDKKTYLWLGIDQPNKNIDRRELSVRRQDSEHVCRLNVWRNVGKRYDFVGQYSLYEWSRQEKITRYDSE